MSTRSRIGIVNDDKTITSVYCHSDGYEEWVGQILKKHYTDKEKIEKMISLGDMSCLDINVDPDPSKPHTFEYDERQDGVCIFYGRDRNDENTKAQKHFNVQDFNIASKKSGAEYSYLYQDGQWISKKVPR